MGKELKTIEDLLNYQPEEVSQDEQTLDDTEVKDDETQGAENLDDQEVKENENNDNQQNDDKTNVTDNNNEQNNESNKEGNEYKPDYNIVIHDKKHEIPEIFKSIIKDEKTEKEVKDILTKAYGLDLYKNSTDKWRNKYEENTKQINEYKNKYEETDKVVNYVAECMDMITEGSVLEGIALLCKGNEKAYNNIITKIPEFINADELTQERLSNKFSDNINRYNQKKMEEHSKYNEQSLQEKYNELLYKQTNDNIDNIVNSNEGYKRIVSLVTERTGNENFFKTYVANLAEKLYPSIEGTDFNELISQSVKGIKQYFGISDVNNQNIRQASPNGFDNNVRQASQAFQNNLNVNQVNPKQNIIIKQKVNKVPSMGNGNGGTINKGGYTSIEDVFKDYL